ncbi:MAG: type IV secretion system protein VirB11, partial [bacterium]
LAEREAKLKAFIHQRRSDATGDEDDENDPFEGDKIAKKNLRYLTKYLDRDDIDKIKEIVINKPEEVGLEYDDGHWEWIKDIDLTASQLDDIARTLANSSGQLFHAGNPILSVKMPGGHRVQIVAGFNAPTGFVFSMRLQRKEKFGLKDFTMPEEERTRVQQLVRDQKTILISGGTGTGKTSYMNALIPSIPDDERLVSMEDVPELRIPHRNWVRLLFSGSDTAMGDQGVLELLNACLRLRPDRIILGEIRKENAFAFCSAINTGHEGSMATIHANSPKMAMDAVINRVMMNGDLPDSAMEVLRRQLKHDIYAVVQLSKIHKGVKAELCVLNEQEDD